VHGARGAWLRAGRDSLRVPMRRLPEYGFVIILDRAFLKAFSARRHRTRAV